MFACYSVFNPITGKFMSDERSPSKRWTKTPTLFFETKKECKEYWDIDEIPKNCTIVRVSYIWKH